MESDMQYAVLHALRCATSQDTAILKPAEHRLKEMEVCPGFHKALLEIFSDKSIDVNIRWLAIVIIKNGIDRYWRKHATNAISEDEKSLIRSQLMSNFNEPANQLAAQFAVLVGKIARLDVPREWPELVPCLLQVVTASQDELHQQRVLFTLYHVIKCLSSRRLAHDRKVFEELTDSIFPFMLHLWNSQMAQFEERVRMDDVRSSQVVLEYAHLSLKVLRKLVVYGFKDPSRHETVKSFVHQCFGTIQNLADAKALFDVNTHMSQKRDKLLLLISNILLDMLQLHPDSYAEYISPTLRLVLAFCFDLRGRPSLSERFTVNLLNLLKDIIINDTYKPSPNGDQSQAVTQACDAKAAILTPDVLSDVVKMLILNYLPLTLEDLNQWNTAPEEFVIEEGVDSWKFSLRACVKVLFIALFKDYRDTLMSVLLDMVKSVPRVSNGNDTSVLLVREAVYTAIGLVSYDIYEALDFDSWFISDLIPELQNKEPVYRIIRRRVIWLVGSWINVKMSASLRPLMYEIVISLLSREEDLVVRLEAANTLKASLDDFEFNVDQFAPYLDSSFGLLFTLLTEVAECDTKMKVLHVMSFLVERVGSGIARFAPALIQRIPLLWQESENHNLLRCTIVNTLTHLAQGLGSASGMLLPIALPVIQLSTDLKQAAHVYLLEDGLMLWETILYNSAQATQDLLQLCCALPSLLETSSEHLRPCLKIIEAYVLLAGDELIAQHGEALVTGMLNLVSDVRMEGLVQVMKTIEVFFRLYPKPAADMFKELVISHIIPAVLVGEEYPMVISMYLSIVSRVVMLDFNLFLLLVQEYSGRNCKAESSVLHDFLQMWFEKLDCISQPERRKLCAVALACMLPTNVGVIAVNFDPLINACVQVLHDICHSPEDDSENRADRIVLSSDVLDIPEEETDTDHDKRKRQLSMRDPVLHIHLDKLVWTKLNELRTAIGDQQFELRLAAIDPDIRMQLQSFMKPYHSSI